MRELMPQWIEAEAIEFAKSERWKQLTDNQIVLLSFVQDLLFLPFSELHRAMEAVLGRPVWTHEFGFPQKLFLEYAGLVSKASISDVIGLLPADKTIVIVGGDE